MNLTIRRVLMGAFLLGLLTSSAWAQGRLATIDLKKVFDNYWKTKQADASMKERGADMEKEYKNMVNDFERAREDYQKLLASAKDQAASAEERDKRSKAAEDKLKYLNDQETVITQYRRQSATTLQEQQKRIRENILGEIRNVVNVKAKSAGFSLVVDTAAESTAFTPFVMYSNNENDITIEVLEQLNKTRPTDLPEKKADDTSRKDEKK